jgi:hypothetical protein
MRCGDFPSRGSKRSVCDSGTGPDRPVPEFSGLPKLDGRTASVGRPMTARHDNTNGRPAQHRPFVITAPIGQELAQKPAPISHAHRVAGTRGHSEPGGLRRRLAQAALSAASCLHVSKSSGTTTTWPFDSPSCVFTSVANASNPNSVASWASTSTDAPFDPRNSMAC